MQLNTIYNKLKKINDNLDPNYIKKENGDMQYISNAILPSSSDMIPTINDKFTYSDSEKLFDVDNILIQSNCHTDIIDTNIKLTKSSDQLTILNDLSPSSSIKCKYVGDILNDIIITHTDIINFQIVSESVNECKINIKKFDLGLNLVYNGIKKYSSYIEFLNDFSLNSGIIIGPNVQKEIRQSATESTIYYYSIYNGRGINIPSISGNVVDRDVKHSHLNPYSKSLTVSNRIVGSNKSDSNQSNTTINNVISATTNMNSLYALRSVNGNTKLFKYYINNFNISPGQEINIDINPGKIYHNSINSIICTYNNKLSIYDLKNTQSSTDLTLPSKISDLSFNSSGNIIVGTENGHIYTIGYGSNTATILNDYLLQPYPIRQLSSLRYDDTLLCICGTNAYLISDDRSILKKFESADSICSFYSDVINYIVVLINCKLTTFRYENGHIINANDYFNTSDIYSSNISSISDKYLICNSYIYDTKYKSAYKYYNINKLTDKRVYYNSIIHFDETNYLYLWLNDSTLSIQQMHILDSLQESDEISSAISTSLTDKKIFKSRTYLTPSKILVHSTIGVYNVFDIFDTTQLRYITTSPKSCNKSTDGMTNIACGPITDDGKMKISISYTTYHKSSYTATPTYVSVDLNNDTVTISEQDQIDDRDVINGIMHSNIGSNHITAYGTRYVNGGNNVNYSSNFSVEYLKSPTIPVLLSYYSMSVLDDEYTSFYILATGISRDYDTAEKNRKQLIYINIDYSQILPFVIGYPSRRYLILYKDNKMSVWDCTTMSKHFLSYDGKPPRRINISNYYQSMSWRFDPTINKPHIEFDVVLPDLEVTQVGTINNNGVIYIQYDNHIYYHIDINIGKIIATYSLDNLLGDNNTPDTILSSSSVYEPLKLNSGVSDLYVNIYNDLSYLIYDNSLYVYELHGGKKNIVEGISMIQDCNLIDNISFDATNMYITIKNNIYIFKFISNREFKYVTNILISENSKMICMSNANFLISGSNPSIIKDNSLTQLAPFKITPNIIKHSTNLIGISDNNSILIYDTNMNLIKSINPPSNIIDFDISDNKVVVLSEDTNLRYYYIYNTTNGISISDIKMTNVRMIDVDSVIIYNSDIISKIDNITSDGLDSTSIQLVYDSHMVDTKINLISIIGDRRIHVKMGVDKTRHYIMNIL